MTKDSPKAQISGGKPHYFPSALRTTRSTLALLVGEHWARNALRSGEHRLPACSRRQLADDSLATSKETSAANVRRPFRQADEKDRLAACAPHTSAITLSCHSWLWAARSGGHNQIVLLLVVVIETAAHRGRGQERRTKAWKHERILPRESARAGLAGFLPVHCLVNPARAGTGDLAVRAGLASCDGP